MDKILCELHFVFLWGKKKLLVISKYLTASVHLRLNRPSMLNFKFHNNRKRQNKYGLFGRVARRKAPLLNNMATMMRLNTPREF